MSLKGIARATLAILDEGQYTAPSGATRSIARALREARSGTHLYTPEALATLLAEEHQAASATSSTARIEVIEGTTQSVARGLVQDEGVEDLVLLGFASARNVCGGFLNGAKSQEEDLARASGLHACLMTAPDYYAINRAQKSLLYTDHIIYSPRVPFFREKNREVLENPFTASVITAPAPNAGQHLRKFPGTEEDVEEALRQRAGYVLAVARARGHRDVLLGAWGCGVFCNAPAQVADAFGRWLESERFATSFDRVVFGIYDRSKRQETLRSFEERFERS